VRARVVVLLSLLAIFPAWQAQAEKRVALVIGNANYQSASSLRNTIGDAMAVAAKLDSLRFDTVQLALDQDARAMRQTIRSFAAVAARADVALVYYAGHGMEMDGKNYLIPTDAMLKSDLDLDYEAIPLHLMMRSIESAGRMRVVVLDACRNNPFAAQMTISGRITRQVTSGLARIEPGADTLVAFAARDGTVADDGHGEHSPFTSALLRHLDTPRLEIGLLFRRVRDTVLAATNRIQEPFVYGSLGGQEFYLNEQATRDTNPGSAPEETRSARSAATADTIVASLAPAEAPQQPTPSARERLARELQRELKRVGCDPGEFDGIWTHKSEMALQKFAVRTRLALHTDTPTPAALDAVMFQKARVCLPACAANEVEADGECVARSKSRKTEKAENSENANKSERSEPARTAVRGARYRQTVTASRPARAEPNVLGLLALGVGAKLVRSGRRCGLFRC
jgi:uncharacterized caspase-like protein